MTTAAPDRAPVDASRMPFVEHLRELRRRLLSSVIGVAVTTAVCLVWSEEIFTWSLGPLLTITDQKLQVLSPMEMFLTYLKLGVLAGLFVGAPWVLLQAWRFVAPGLYAHEKRWVLPFVILGTLFFVGGGAFAFYVVMPIGFGYLATMAPDIVESNYRVSEYIGFLIQMLLAFGIVFELPLIMWILGAAGIVRAETFARFRKYWVIAAFVIGGILTPPDPLTQFMMAIPLLAFFEIGIFGARLLARRPAPAPPS